MSGKIIKSYKYRIYPKKSQIKKMEFWLKLCALMYNFFIDITETAYKKHNKRLGMYDMTSFIPRLRKGNETLKNVYSTLFYDVARRVSNDYKEFFRRWRNGEKNNRPPNMRDINKYCSFTYPSIQGVRIKDKHLWLSKIGDIKIVMHRPLPAEGKIKSCTIKRYPTGKWFAIFLCEMPAPEQRKGDAIVGIDLGIEPFAVLSDGTEITNRRFFKNNQKRFAKAQRKMAKSKKGTAEYEKWRKIAAKIRAKSINQKKDFFHKFSNEIIKKYDIIAIEDLRIQQMLKNYKLANSIIDASWRTFARILESKATSMGAKVIKVDPANTSKMCSSCGTITDIKLGEETFACPICGLILGRDHNAALNIKRLAAQSLGEIPEGPKGNADVPTRCLYTSNSCKKKVDLPSFKSYTKQKHKKKQIRKQKIQYDKYEDAIQQLFLYILNNYRPPDILTRNVMCNLMYLCDKMSYEESGDPITHGEYIKAKYCASLSRLDGILNKMIENKVVKRKFFKANNSLYVIYITSCNADISIFSPDQKNVIDQTIAEYSYLDEKTIFKFVQSDEVFRNASPREKINIPLTFNQGKDIIVLTGG